LRLDSPSQDPTDASEYQNSSKNGLPVYSYSTRNIFGPKPKTIKNKLKSLIDNSCAYIETMNKQTIDYQRASTVNNSVRVSPKKKKKHMGSSVERLGVESWDS